MQIISLYTQKLQLKPWKNVIDLNSCTPVDIRRRYNVFIVNFEHVIAGWELRLVERKSNRLHHSQGTAFNQTDVIPLMQIFVITTLLQRFETFKKRSNDTYKIPT